LDLGVPIPTITAAVDARLISAVKEQRVAASKFLAGPSPKKTENVKQFVQDVKAALYCSKICSYTQGMAMLAVANAHYNYGIHLDEVARIWKAGCIIRAVFLDEIKKVFKEKPDMPNMLMADRFRDAVAQRQDAWRRVLTTALASGVATPAFSASLAYYDSFRRAHLPANLIQAQRDFFGAHTYERTDKPGVFHTEWAAEQPAHHPGADLNRKK
jgi:6-phosphogluconate dehydrogenase